MTAVSARAAAGAFLAASFATLAADGVLAIFTALIDLGGSGGSWWVQAHLVERSRWVALALLLRVVARRLETAEAAAATGPSVAWRAVGGAVMGLPLLWILAGWIVQAVLFTVAGRWDIDGRIFLEMDYYRRLFVNYAPWLLGGLMTRMASRHV